MKRFESKYGTFSGDGKEYVITDPYTPRPWINVISNGDYSLLVSQTGGGYSFRDNAEQNRLTRSFQDIVKDNWGKYFYIRDKSSGDYFSAALNPVRGHLDFYQVRHGIGYSVFERESLGIRSSLRVFVHADKPVEFASLTLTNLGCTARELDITGYFEWAPGLAYDNHREFQRLFAELSFDPALNAVLINKCLWGFPDEKGRHNNDTWPYTGFFACSHKASSFDTDKESFIGMYGSERTPLGMGQPELSGRAGRFVDPACAMRVPVRLEAGASATVVFVLGMAMMGAEDYAEFTALACKDACDAAFADVNTFWDKLIGEECVCTPDPAFDIMTNRWTKYQTLSCRMWAKAAYYQISGGIGYRDQLQDSLIGLEIAPDLTRKQILLHAGKQFVEGDVLHWWLTLHSWGPRTKCSDDFLWLAYVAYQYYLETGDLSVYCEQAPFLNAPAESIYNHCLKAIGLSLSRMSPRGIPLMGDHDWNDGLSAVGNGMIGESFWVAEFLYRILTDYTDIAVLLGDAESGLRLRAAAEKLSADFNACAWDGEWYLQATNDAGGLVGSRSCREGKIFLNPQLWAVISGIAPRDKQLLALEAVKKHLLKAYGALLLAPAYSVPDPDIGYITRYAPGLRENGGVYTHAATWAVWAFAAVGDAEHAYKAYRGICPPNRSADIDRYQCEPYVTAGNTDGPDSPYFGKGGWTWYTGSAQWLHRVGVHWILGIRPEKDGLRIAPCMPADWKGYRYARRFRNAHYTVSVKRTGIRAMKVDGVSVAGNLVKPFPSGTHTVEVEVE